MIDHLGYGGAPIVVKNIVEQMNNQRIEIFVCALRTNPNALPIKAKLISLTYRRYNPCAILAILKLCKQYKIDIVHAHLTKSVITSLMASFISKTPVIVHEHGPIFRKGLPFSIYRVLLKMFHNRAAAIIANSQATVRQLVQLAAIDADGVEVIPNALDFGPFDSSKMARSKARAELGISQTDIAIGFVGRLHKVKGVDLLIEAFALLSQKSSNYLLLLAGDGPERESLKRLAVRLGIAERVRFLGVCPNPAEIMAGFDVGVVPSRQESFGIVVLELMRMRVPIVSSGVDGLAELVTDGATGLITKENTPEEIADAVQCLANDKKLQRQLIDNAYNFSEQFNVGEHVKKIEKLYLEVLRDSDSSKHKS